MGKTWMLKGRRELPADERLGALLDAAGFRGCKGGARLDPSTGDAILRLEKGDRMLLVRVGESRAIAKEFYRRRRK